MLSRGLTCALRLRSRALSSSVPSNKPITSAFEAQAVPQGTHSMSMLCVVCCVGRPVFMLPMLGAYAQNAHANLRQCVFLILTLYCAGLNAIPSSTFSTSNVCGIFAAGGSLQQEGPSLPCSRDSRTKRAVTALDPPAAVHSIHTSRTIAAEQALVTRLASVWGMPPEVLASNVAALSDLLKPCGRDTAAHALWVRI